MPKFDCVVIGAGNGGLAAACKMALEGKKTLLIEKHNLPMFEKMWQFSSFLVKKGLKVVEVSNDEQFIDIDLKKVDYNSSELMLRATGNGHPDFSEKIIDGVTRKVVIVGGKSYIP